MTLYLGLARGGDEKLMAQAMSTLCCWLPKLGIRRVVGLSSLLVAFVVCSGVLETAGAQTGKIEDQGKSQQSLPQKDPVARTATGQAGRDIRIGVFASLRPDCTPGALPVIRLNEEPKHGKVTVKEAKVRTTNFQKCLAAEAPAFIVIYRSSPDFEGRDEVALEVGTGDKRQIQRITITVTNAKGMQRI
jgi:hypothetical protein